MPTEKSTKLTEALASGQDFKARILSNADWTTEEDALRAVPKHKTAGLQKSPIIEVGPHVAPPREETVSQHLTYTSSKIISCVTSVDL